MLSTKETVSGLRKVTTLVDALVKRFPQYTHQQVAKILLDECGKTIWQLKTDIESAKAEKKNPFQKVGSLNRLEKYQPIIYAVADMLEELGKPQTVAVEVKQAA